MRITFGSGQVATMTDLERAAEELTRRQREVSSGKRIHAPSDDPTASAAIVRERADIAAVDQFVRSADSVTSRLTVVDTVLSDLVLKLQAARSATVAGQGSVQTTEQREATAQELEGLRDAIFDDLNTTFRGTYLFSGGLGLQPPYTRAADGTVSGYLGDANALSVDVDRNRAMQISFDGSTVVQGADTQGLFDTLAQVIQAVRTNDEPTLAAGLQHLEAAFNRVTRVQSGVGADLNALDDQRARLGEMKRANVARVSKAEDTNMAESISAMQRADTAYQSALGAIATRTKLSLMDYLK
jgi:flagellar hook-associated protein 3 FlgL